MKSLQEQAAEKGIQIIVTTQNPNLASAVDLENIVLINGNCAFSTAKEQTKLEESDYRFLQRFLDVTKANLFSARGVMIVNVGGVGLRRYARIFQRMDVERDGDL